MKIKSVASTQAETVARMKSIDVALQKISSRVDTLSAAVEDLQSDFVRKSDLARVDSRLSELQKQIDDMPVAESDDLDQLQRRMSVLRTDLTETRRWVQRLGTQRLEK